MKKRMQDERGFTLIELLTVVAIIGVLGALSMTSFYMYRSDAYYSIVETTIKNARLAFEAGLSSPEEDVGAVSLVSQSSGGAISDPAAQTLLPGMRLPENIEFQVSYNPECVDSSCESEFLSVNHCIGKKGASWIRFGDGININLENLATGGC